MHAIDAIDEIKHTRKVADPIPAGIEKRLLCATILDSVRAFYEDPANMRSFEAWQQKRSGPDDLPRVDPTP